MLKFTIFLCLYFLLSFTAVYSQQDPAYTQYMYNMAIVNPAYAGSKGFLSLGLLHRAQWINIEGAPRTTTLFAHTPVGRNTSLGLSVIADKIGPVKEENFNLDFSYTLQTSSYGNLAFGLKGGLTVQSVGLTSIILPEDPNDVLFSENINEVYPNFGIGAYYYTENYYIGLSTPSLLKTNHFERGDGFVTEAREDIHYFLTSGYVFNISEDLKYKPSFLARVTNGAPISIDLSSNFLINDTFELGVNYRIDSSISALFNFGITSNLRIGYAYDYQTNNLGNFNSGSHEILLLWSLNSFNKDLKSPRFF